MLQSDPSTNCKTYFECIRVHVGLFLNISPMHGLISFRYCHGLPVLLAVAIEKQGFQILDSH